MDCELFTSLSQTSHNAFNLVSGKLMDGSIREGSRVKDTDALNKGQLGVIRQIFLLIEHSDRPECRLVAG